MIHEGKVNDINFTYISSSSLLAQKYKNFLQFSIAFKGRESLSKILLLALSCNFTYKLLSRVASSYSLYAGWGFFYCIITTLRILIEWNRYLLYLNSCPPDLEFGTLTKWLASRCQSECLGRLLYTFFNVLLGNQPVQSVSLCRKSTRSA